MNIDEVPQFLNVLLGDMSIVGPRPERPHFVERFLDQFDRYNVRHTFKVGITGWAQVNGWRGDTSIAKRVEYDLLLAQLEPYLRPADHHHDRPARLQQQECLLRIGAYRLRIRRLSVRPSSFCYDPDAVPSRVTISFSSEAVSVAPKCLA